MATKRRTHDEHDQPARAEVAAEVQTAAPDAVAAEAVDAEPPLPEPAEAEPDTPDTEALASELEAMNVRHLRLAADFDNFKRRARQERMETIQYAAATLAGKLLPVLDDAHLALEHAPDGADESWLKGIRMTFQKLDEALASVGVEPIEAVGTAFDPKMHEAIGSEETDDHPDDTVVAELRRGYRMHDRVLRPALVKVSRRAQ